jgi:TatD DNase family protein
MNIPFCDIHTHMLDSPAAEHRDQALQHAKKLGMELLLTATAKYDEWHPSLELADGHNVFVALGIHPLHCHEWNESIAQELEGIIQNNPDKVKAVAEIGLDFFNGRINEEKQYEALSAQIQIAQTHKLPVILHIRKAWPDFFGLVRDMRITEIHGACHCFNGSPELLDECLKLGLNISFAGPVTYANADRLRQTAARVPPHRLLAETDTPYLPTHNLDRNYSLPQDTLVIIKTLARARKEKTATIAQRILENARNLFATNQ